MLQRYLICKSLEFSQKPTLMHNSNSIMMARIWHSVACRTVIVSHKTIQHASHVHLQLVFLRPRFSIDNVFLSFLVPRSLLATVQTCCYFCVPGICILYPLFTILRYVLTEFQSAEVDKLFRNVLTRVKILPTFCKCFRLLFSLTQCTQNIPKISIFQTKDPGM